VTFIQQHGYTTSSEDRAGRSSLVVQIESLYRFETRAEKTEDEAEAPA